MDPLTHIFLTRKLISKRPLAIIAGVAPDAPFYLTYPAWVIRQGQLKHALQTNDWPDPPVWMETSHHMFHSLPLLFITALLLWTVSGRIPRHIFLAWVLHILIDIPTHSRRRWGPRFLWPISTYSFDGLSWAEAALQLARSSSGDASLEID